MFLRQYNHWLELFMILHVTSAKYLHDYQIEVALDEGRKGIADLSNVLRGTMFAPLRDRAMFRCLIPFLSVKSVEKTF